MTVQIQHTARQRYAAADLVTGVTGQYHTRTGLGTDHVLHGIGVSRAALGEREGAAAHMHAQACILLAAAERQDAVAPFRHIGHARDDTIDRHRLTGAAHLETAPLRGDRCGGQQQIAAGRIHKTSAVQMHRRTAQRGFVSRHHAPAVDPDRAGQSGTGVGQDQITGTVLDSRTGSGQRARVGDRTGTGETGGAAVHCDIVGKGLRRRAVGEAIVFEAHRVEPHGGSRVRGDRAVAADRITAHHAHRVIGQI